MYLHSLIYLGKGIFPLSPGWEGGGSGDIPKWDFAHYSKNLQTTPTWKEPHPKFVNRRFRIRNPGLQYLQARDSDRYFVKVESGKGQIRIRSLHPD